MLRTRQSAKRKAKLAGHKPANTNNFLAGSRKMSWFTVGASIFASNLGSEHFIGLSGSAAATGISVAAFELNALIILQLATWLFMPVLLVSKISTLPEYMSKRFGGKRIRTYLAVLSILLYIFTKISVNLFSGGIFLQQAIGWNLYTSAMFVLCLTSVMTLTGGLKGAMLIDNLQAVVMTLGASMVAAKALLAIGGWEGLRQQYPLAYPRAPDHQHHHHLLANLSEPSQCGRPNPRAFQMLRPMHDRDMPWLGFLLGQTPASVWYWAADQMMVQRFLSARSLAHVQGSAVFAGYLKILPFLLMVIPGMISRCLYKEEVACVDPEVCRRYCQSTVSCSNTAYPRLVLELMPMGARGMMVAAMVAALMGDLSNVFNSASALFSCDIWPLFRKQASQKEQERAGRLFVICLVLASIMWIPVIQEMQGGQLFIYIQAVAAMFAPPIAAVYVCAIFWGRTNEQGAFWALMLGFALGCTRMALSFLYKEPACGQPADQRPWLLQMHYMYYAAFLFWASLACALLVSALTKPPATFRLIRTTFWTRFDTSVRKDDKNVFELKPTASKRRRPPVAVEQPALFTIEEQQEKRADLSSVVVDISRAAAGRPPLQQQASLSASASAAVGAASEAGKLLANRLASEVKAAAVQLAAGPSRIRFENLQGDDEDDDSSDRPPDDDDDDGGEQADDERRRRRRPRAAQQSALSAALSSYKQKQKGGYRKAADEDEDVDDDDDNDDDEDDEDEGEEIDEDDAEDEDDEEEDEHELIRLNRSHSLKAKVGGAGGERAAASPATPGGRKRAQSVRRQPTAKRETEPASGEQAAKSYKCLDNSVSLLLKSKFEETLLRIAVVAIVLVAVGIFALFSLPPRAPPAELVRVLNETI